MKTLSEYALEYADSEHDKKHDLIVRHGIMQPVSREDSFNGFRAGFKQALTLLDGMLRANPETSFNVNSTAWQMFDRLEKVSNDD